MKAIVIAIVCAAVAVGAIVVLRSTRKPVDKLELLRKEVEPKGGVIFETQLEGKPEIFLLLDCNLFRIDVAGKEVVRTKVLRPGFNLWFSPCWGQTIRMEDGFLRVYLENRAFGAGGGNFSGGEYRSRNGQDWEKHTPKGWRPIAEAQD